MSQHYADVVHATLDELSGTWVDLFTRYNPMADAILKKTGRERLKGLEYLFNPVINHPGQAIGIVTGTETIPNTSNQVSVQGVGKLSEALYSFTLSSREMRIAADDKDGLVRLVKDKPAMAMKGFYDLNSRQLTMGDAPGMGTIPTLNGDATFSPDGAVQNGFLSFELPDAQTGAVHGLLRRGSGAGAVREWYNQVQVISNFAHDGRSKLRLAISDANMNGAQLESSISLAFADRETYANWVNDMDDKLIIMNRETKKGDLAPEGRKDSVMLNSRVEMFEDPNIKLASFTNLNAQKGLVYMLNPSDWVIKTTRQYTTGGTKDAKNTFFEMKTPVLSPTQDVWQFRILLSYMLACHNIRSQAVVLGGAQ